MATICVALATCRTMPCIGTLSFWPGCRSTAAFTGSPGYERPQESYRAVVVPRLAGCVSGLGREYRAGPNPARPRLRESGAVFGDGFLRRCRCRVSSGLDIVAGCKPYPDVWAARYPEVRRLGERSICSRFRL